MIAETIVKQKLDKRLALVIARITGPRVERIVAGLITDSAPIAFGSWRRWALPGDRL